MAQEFDLSLESIPCNQTLQVRGQGSAADDPAAKSNAALAQNPARLDQVRKSLFRHQTSHGENAKRTVAPKQRLRNTCEVEAMSRCDDGTRQGASLE